MSTENTTTNEQQAPAAVRSSEFLPCPFCGSPAGEVIHHFHPQRLADGTTYEARSVQCSQKFKDCMGAGPIKDSEPEARAAWNRRWQSSPRYAVQSEHPFGTRRVYWVLDTHQNDKQVTTDTYYRSTADRWCEKLNAENTEVSDER